MLTNKDYQHISRDLKASVEENRKSYDEQIKNIHWKHDRNNAFLVFLIGVGLVLLSAWISTN